MTKAVLETCHGVGGFLDDPAQCHFDPSSLVCKAGQSEACLSASEVATLSKIYSGRARRRRKVALPRLSARRRGGPRGLELWITGTDRNAARERCSTASEPAISPTWCSTNRTGISAAKPSPRIWRRRMRRRRRRSTRRTRISSAFRRPAASCFSITAGPMRGSRRPARSTTTVGRRQDGRHRGHPILLSAVHGPRHGSLRRGPGPNAVGGVFGLPSPSRDPAHDVVSALAHWVEDGVAPTQITATSYRDDDPGKGIVAQRPWCAYPAVARFRAKAIGRRPPASPVRRSRRESGSIQVILRSCQVAERRIVSGGTAVCKSGSNLTPVRTVRSCASEWQRAFDALGLVLLLALLCASPAAAEKRVAS